MTQYECPPLLHKASRDVFANNLLPFALREIEAEKTPGAVVRIDDDTPIPLGVVNDIQKSARKMQIDHHWELGDTVIIDNDWILRGWDRTDDYPRNNSWVKELIRYEMPDMQR